MHSTFPNAVSRIGFCLHLFGCNSHIGPLDTKRQALVVGEMVFDTPLYKPKSGSLVYVNNCDEWFRPVGRVFPCLLIQQRGKEEWQRMKQ